MIGMQKNEQINSVKYIDDDIRIINIDVKFPKLNQLNLFLYC